MVTMELFLRCSEQRAFKERQRQGLWQSKLCISEVYKAFLMFFSITYRKLQGLTGCNYHSARVNKFSYFAMFASNILFIEKLKY